MRERSGMMDMFDTWIGTMGLGCTQCPNAPPILGRVVHFSVALMPGKNKNVLLPVAVLEWPQQGSAVAQGTAPVFPDQAGVAQPPGGAHIPATRGWWTPAVGRRRLAYNRCSPLDRASPPQWLAFLPLSLSAQGVRCESNV